MADHYLSFADLSRVEMDGRDFQVRVRRCPGTTAIIATHGGGIEPGTSELADAIAGEEFSFYAFEGTKHAGNSILHITSSRFDEPQAISVISVSPRVVALHGEDSPKEYVYLGG